MQTFFNWVLISSKNPANFSMTLKGLVSFLVVLGVSDIVSLEGVSDSLVSILVALGQLITAGITLWGFIRKIYFTFKSK